MVVDNELSAQPTLIFLAAIFTLSALGWASTVEALCWLTLVIGAKVALLELCRRFRARPPLTAAALYVWQRNLILVEAVNGSVWGAFALMGLADRAIEAPDRAITSHMFVFACFVLIVAVRMTFAAPIPAMLYVGSLPMAAAVVVRLLGAHDAVHLALAGMAVSIQLYFLVIARSLRRAALDKAELRAEKDNLIAALEQAKAQSDDACERAESASVSKSRFLATMSHELRTPLNAIMGFSEVMKTEMLGPLENESYRQYAAHIHDSGRHLLNLINEILDLSRIEAGRYELYEKDVRLDDLAHECVLMLQLRAHTKGLDLGEEHEPGAPPLHGDERAIRQIGLNLLSNAVKFTPRGGRVDVRTGRAANGGLFLSVRDDGPGIPADEIPKVMQAFGQGSLAQRTAEGGTGLGLTIVKSLVELHGGHFELRSVVGVGTEAIALFPPDRVSQNGQGPAPTRSLGPRRPPRILLSPTTGQAGAIAVASRRT